MSDDIQIELGTPEITINYDSLAEKLWEYSEDSLQSMVDERIDNYCTYELDVSDVVYECVHDAVSDAVNSQIESLLGEVTPSGLCSLGLAFSDAVQVVMKHHIDMKEILTHNESIEGVGGLSQLVHDALRKEVYVNVSFVDKQPAEVVSTVGEIGGVEDTEELLDVDTSTPHNRQTGI